MQIVGGLRQQHCSTVEASVTWPTPGYALKVGVFCVLWPASNVSCLLVVSDVCASVAVTILSAGYMSVRCINRVPCPVRRQPRLPSCAPKTQPTWSQPSVSKHSTSQDVAITSVHSSCDTGRMHPTGSLNHTPCKSPTSQQAPDHLNPYQTQPGHKNWRGQPKR